ncbi:MAG: hypothetical protein HZA32_12760 [Opitutae bacterium]|nr:hypothetical protein [Opitutae bacterium]
MSPVTPRRIASGFTLMELLVVVGLIAGMSFFLLRGFSGGSGTSLQAGQAQLANLITAARGKAATTGRRTRVLIHADALTNPDRRFLRFVVLQLANDATASPAGWTTVDSGFLPENIFVVPSSLTLASGLVADTSAWKKVTAPVEDVVSDLLGQTVSVTVEGDSAAQTFAGFVCTPNGTLGSVNGGFPPKGLLVLAVGAARAPGSYAAGDAPVQLQRPEAVRGLAVSAYGIPTLLNDLASL